MKKLLKQLLIPVLTNRVFASLGKFWFGNGLPIFMLHRMHTGEHPYAGITPDYLRQCLQYLVDNGYNFVSLEDAVLSLRNKSPLAAKSVVFTMDDGYWDQAEIAAPIFLEFNCPVTLFVITGMLDNILWPWDAKVTHLIDISRKMDLQLNLGGKEYHLAISNSKEKNLAREMIRNIIKSQDASSTDKLVNQVAFATGETIPKIPPGHFKPMSWDKARQLEHDGVRFAPHTITHRMLSRMDDKSSEDEIAGSWKRLTDELKSPSPVFCYPTGRRCDYGTREVELLKKSELIGAVSTVPAPVHALNTSTEYMYNLPRLSLPKDFEDFIQCCSWIEYAKSRFRSYSRH